MDSFNRIVSFVLGLVVVLVFFAVVTGKLKLPGKLAGIAAKPTPTPTKSINPTPASSLTVNGNSQTAPLGSYYKSQTGNTANKTASIPSTGLPTLFIPSLLAGGLGGSFLRKSGKKRTA
ncbi:hypothetical protein M1328_00140 [Patescibacteria group bacterium]|nr:hypothetical protein [Patescibacteria group bacterium]